MQKNKYPKTKRAKILGIKYTFGSGLAQLILEDSKTHDEVIIGADAGATFRSLDEAFGGVNEAKGQEIFYTETSYGTMSSFLPVKESLGSGE